MSGWAGESREQGSQRRRNSFLLYLHEAGPACDEDALGGVLRLATTGLGHAHGLGWECGVSVGGCVRVECGVVGRRSRNHVHTTSLQPTTRLCWIVVARPGVGARAKGKRRKSNRRHRATETAGVWACMPKGAATPQPGTRDKGGQDPPRDFQCGGANLELFPSLVFVNNWK